jgi:predicted nuclease of predicted toxin-antitoxin system
MDFLANENFPVFSIKLLRKAGHKTASIIEETPGAKDLDILKRAQKENLVILTFDRDYGELIYRHKSFIPCGVVYFRFNPSAPEEPAIILLKILKKDKISILGKFTVIERVRIRQRPFHE